MTKIGPSFRRDDRTKIGPSFRTDDPCAPFSAVWVIRELRSCWIAFGLPRSRSRILLEAWATASGLMNTVLVVPKTLCVSVDCGRTAPSRTLRRRSTSFLRLHAAHPSRAHQTAPCASKRNPLTSLNVERETLRAHTGRSSASLPNLSARSSCLPSCPASSSARFASLRSGLASFRRALASLSARFAKSSARSAKSSARLARSSARLARSSARLARSSARFASLARIPTSLPSHPRMSSAVQRGSKT